LIDGGCCRRIAIEKAVEALEITLQLIVPGK
jgi:hypothetical protein